MGLTGHIRTFEEILQVFLFLIYKKNGFKPGIWLAPFLVEKRSKLFVAHPEWMVRNRDGEIAFPMKWRTGEAGILDGTHPEVQQFLTALFRRLGAMGWAYAKLDFFLFFCREVLTFGLFCIIIDIE